MSRVAVIGAGAFGTALACVARRAGADAIVWARDPEIARSIDDGQGNPVYLPDIALESGIAATTDMGQALRGADAVLLAVPSQFLRAMAKRLRPELPADVPVVLCAKGIERESCALMTDVVAQTLPGAPVAVLSGPTFAREVALGLPTAITLGAADKALGERLVGMIGSTAFRPYWTDDIVGAEIGGASKNVVAIACGIMIGRGMGDNARAATMTRGLAEIVRLGRALGARGETLMGLSGIGDLSLTCNGMLSRNLTLGVALGEGRSLSDILGERRSVTEGVATASSVVQLAEHNGVDMPIARAVDQIVNRGAEIDTTIAEVLSRPFRPESPEIDNGFGPKRALKIDAATGLFPIAVAGRLQPFRTAGFLCLVAFGFCAGFPAGLVGHLIRIVPGVGPFGRAGRFFGFCALGHDP